MSALFVLAVVVLGGFLLLVTNMVKKDMEDVTEESLHASRKILEEDEHFH